jgi:hypothetical protein
MLRSVRLHGADVKILGMICDRGGEIPWDWSKLKPEAKAHVASMINRGILIEREHVTDARAISGVLHIRATELGRAVYAQLEAARVAADKSLSAPSGKSSPAEETPAKETNQ